MRFGVVDRRPAGRHEHHSGPGANHRFELEPRWKSAHLPNTCYDQPRGFEQRQRMTERLRSICSVVPNTGTGRVRRAATFGGHVRRCRMLSTLAPERRKAGKRVPVSSG